MADLALPYWSVRTQSVGALSSVGRLLHCSIGRGQRSEGRAELNRSLVSVCPSILNADPFYIRRVMHIMV
jgi:hypothetical protein